MTAIREPTRLAFIVVSFGSSTLLMENLLPAVQACSPAIVVVVDCWSSMDERDKVSRLCSEQRWELVALPDNRGFGGGMNAGAARARELGATQLLLLNPDARIKKPALELLRAAVIDDPYALISPRIVDANGRQWFDGALLHLHDGSTSSRQSSPSVQGEVWEWISGACMALSMELWDAVGGFDESYFLYWEDIDLSRRVILLGGRLKVVAEASVVHEEGGTHEDKVMGHGKSGTYYRYMIRNRLLFATQHLDADGIQRWRRSSLRSARAILLQGGRRQFLRPLTPLLSAGRGLREGNSLAIAALRLQHPRRSA